MTAESSSEIDLTIVQAKPKRGCLENSIGESQIGRRNLPVDIPSGDLLHVVCRYIRLHFARDSSSLEQGRFADDPAERPGWGVVEIQVERHLRLPGPTRIAPSRGIGLVAIPPSFGIGYLKTQRIQIQHAVAIDRLHLDVFQRQILDFQPSR